MGSYDAILLLGLRLSPEGVPRHELALRIEEAAACYREGLAPLIIPCGGQTPGTPVSEAAVMRDALVRLGVPESAIHVEDQSQITVENMLNARRLLGKDWPRVIVVTSDYHMLRARLICRFSAHMHSKGRKARIPKAEVRWQRIEEPLHTIDYLLGYQTGRFKRPKWYLKLMYGLFDRIEKGDLYGTHRQ